MKIEIRGGKIYDPANGAAGEVRSIWIDSGRIVPPPARPEAFRADRVLDASGRIIMPGGVDIHSHIAGAAVNRARRLEPGRAGAPAIVPPAAATGFRYAALGYTTAVEAAIPPGGARQCHLELDGIPCIDKAMLLVLSDQPLILDAIEKGDPARMAALIGHFLEESGAFGIKAVNPGGAAHWRRCRGMIEGLDRPVGGTRATPGRIIAGLAEAARRLKLPHALHLHANRLGIPGNAATTVETLQLLDGLPVHLAHLQFHSYDERRGKKRSAIASGAKRIIDALESHPLATADIGQVMFGAAMTLTADRPVEHLLWKLTGNRWVNIDAELECGCGMVPIRYQPRSFTSAVQWAIGLELLLHCRDPWRLALSTDHPNGGSFLSYPRIVAALLDRGFREEEMARANPKAIESTSLRELSGREYTLSEIAIITRAAPARMLGLARKGHLGPGADADIAIYNDEADRLRMFESPRWVIKAGRIIIEDGELRDPAPGATLRAGIETDGSAAGEVNAWRSLHSSIHPSQFGLSAGEKSRLAGVRGGG